MVRLLETSNIDGQLFPLTREWDNLVRKNWAAYQNLIDKQTYQIQRTQRFLFVQHFHYKELEISSRLRLRYQHPKPTQEKAENRRSKERGNGYVRVD